jgi:hypothetical protein
MTWARIQSMSVGCAAPALLLVTAVAARAERPPTACELVTAGEVSRTLHVGVGHGRLRIHSRHMSSCSFPIRKGGSVAILLHRGASKEWVSWRRDTVSSRATFRPVNGIADPAFVLDRHNDGAALYVFSGEFYLQISVSRPGGADTAVAAAEELTRDALWRLGTMSAPANRNTLESQ